MAEPAFRLPTAGFDQVTKILKAYYSASRGSTDTAVTLDDVARRSAINRTGVSANNAFLASVGLLEGGNAKRLTPLGIRAALSLDHPGTLEAHEAWSEVIQNSPDLERIVDAVRIRGGMDEAALLSHIVLTAGVPKTSRWLTGARTIIDMLEFGGLIQDVDGVFRAPIISEEITAIGESLPSAEETVVSPREGRGRAAGAVRQNVVVNVHIWVNAAEADFEKLSDEIRELLTRLSAT